MADVTAVEARAGARATLGERLKKRWRVLLRAVHRDVGYVAVGLTFIYALSGLAVNHVKDWDPNFHEYSTTHDLGIALSDDDDEAARTVLDRLAIHETPTEVYRANDEIEILLDHRTLHANVKTGTVIDEGQKPRFLLRFANWLHLNRGKKAWTYVADSYAAALLFLALSGMFMIAGKKGLVGRGAFFVVLGVAIPVAYVVLSGGP